MSLDPDKLTPSMTQYYLVKKEHKDFILFFRMGDFYEMFDSDAKIASNILGIVLTKKKGAKNQDGTPLEIPMCGIPFHSYENYVSRLIKRGYKVAICEQLETPLEAKKRGSKEIVKRAVTRIITPGTLIESSFLENDNYNFLLSIYIIGKEASVAWLDISTGDFYIQNVKKEDLNSLIYKISPKEILIAESFDKSIMSEEFFPLLTYIDDKEFQKTKCFDILNNIFANKEILVSSLKDKEKFSCGILLNYLLLTHKELPNVSFPKSNYDRDFLKMDLFTIKSLEILKSYSGSSNGSLKKSIDFTSTSQGARLLSDWLTNPLVSIDKIKARQEVVSFFVDNPDSLEAIINILKNIPDIERAVGRVVFKKASLYDLVIIKNALKQLSMLRNIFFQYELPVLLQELVSSLAFFNDLLNTLEESINDNVTMQSKASDFIKKKFNTILDLANSEKMAILNEINELQQVYALRTKINGLKIGYNNVVGYFIEISNKNTKDISQFNEFIHKSTTSSVVRYTTEELISLEGKLSIVLTKIKSLENQILEEIFNKILEVKNDLQQASKTIAIIDILVSFAKSAFSLNLVKPTITEDNNLEIINGRHIVVENSLKKDNCNNFVPNDCVMGTKKIFLITGPNMSGKSTFIRQNALIIILAQIGSFVPADKATIGITDAIFSRVGASDDLFKGQSTFMVEMLELAVILNNATDKSFLILDEIGRGTSTYDGISIAWATLEYLNNKIKSRALFATHYHELIKLQDSLDMIDCYYVKVEEHNNSIIFMHHVERGIVTKSYGIDVADIAGIPSSVTKRAKQILKNLESGDLPLFNFVQEEKIDNPSSEIENLELLLSLVNEIKSIDENNLTPKMALDIIFNLKEKLN